MIRSITDYAAVLFENISDISKDKVETIQYYSMLHILKIPPETSHTEMREQLGTDTLSSRHKKLKEKYISTSKQSTHNIMNINNSAKTTI